MIIIALGANLPSRYGSPHQTLLAAIDSIKDHDIDVIAVSNIYATAPLPPDPDQPDYCNAVIVVETTMSIDELLNELLNIEQDFGRVRTVRNAPRCIDLDLIAYDDQVRESDSLTVPHPRMHERLFVLKPLADIAPQWTHPVLKKDVGELMIELGDDQSIELSHE